MMMKIFGCLVIFMSIVMEALGSGMENNILAEKTNPPFPRIANCYSAGLTPWSSSQDIDEIARIDLLIGGIWCDWYNSENVKKLSDQITELRKRNPNIIILDFSVSAPYADPKDPTFPKSGWLKQPNGDNIDGWPGTRMINLMKQETRSWLAERCVRSVKEYKLDGIFIDCMAGTFDWWACNIASQTPCEIDADEDGQPDNRDWLNQKWVESKTEIVQMVRRAIGSDAIFMTNQGGEWSFYDTNGVLFEDNLDYVLDKNMNWDDVLEAYLHWTNTPYRPNVTTIVSSSGIEPPFNPWKSLTQEDRDTMLDRGRNLLNRMRFGLATTLMGDGYFAYDLHTRWRGQRWWYPEYDASLGYPKSKAEAQTDGTWRREFDGGTVIVNPTFLDVRVKFGERLFDVSSEKVDTEFIIPSYDGRLLLKTDKELNSGKFADPEPLFTLDGAKRIVQRENATICRLGNFIAYFDVQGRLVSLSDGKNIYSADLQAILVSDDRWANFDYVGNTSQLINENEIQFSGERVEKGVRLSYIQVVRVEGDSLLIGYKWKALTDGNLHAWRQQIDFPISQYVGGHFIINGTKSALPANPQKGNMYAQGVREIMMSRPNGIQTIIKSTRDTFIQDERIYGGKEYRVWFMPMDYNKKSFKTGDTWEYMIEIRPVSK